ncbi:hypothetical protein IAQ61_003138 [Plenodomus lingam]|uniref:uncharacterized protein n=1 Tax=Leptosphaeria maculans TaxID=5022 RepID=UPI003324BAD8|nr:hypothetical protein IAQ61_003138 [Plenodomus lingam]
MMLAIVTPLNPTRRTPNTWQSCTDPQQPIRAGLHCHPPAKQKPTHLSAPPPSPSPPTFLGLLDEYRFRQELDSTVHQSASASSTGIDRSQEHRIHAQNSHFFLRSQQLVGPRLSACLVSNDTVRPLCPRRLASAKITQESQIGLAKRSQLGSEPFDKPTTGLTFFMDATVVLLYGFILRTLVKLWPSASFSRVNGEPDVLLTGSHFDLAAAWMTPFGPDNGIASRARNLEPITKKWLTKDSAQIIPDLIPVDIVREHLLGIPRE